MRRVPAVIVSALIAITGSMPASAENHMAQSPLLMRRAGPSCQPGDLGGDPEAGYYYHLGPCAGPDAASAAPAAAAAGRNRRRF